MESPNVEHLLRNYRVSDISQIQKRLKGDVDKKKNDLKTLIGERYNELLDATDSIENMKESVKSLIDSLKDLGSVLEKAQTAIKNENDDFNLNSDEYTKAIVSKVLFDLPLLIWNSLAIENIILATYYYFLGISIYKTINRDHAQILQYKIHYYNKQVIEDLNDYIVENCWKCVASESLGSDVDHSKLADIFSCIFLLKNCAIDDLSNQFYAKQTENILKCSQSNVELSNLLETLLNIILNTIKCSRVFYGDENYEALISQRYKKIINSTHDMNWNSITLLKSHYANYTIASDLSCKPNELNFKLSKDKIQNWVDLTKQKIGSILGSKLKKFTSIKDINQQIGITEKKLINDSRFSEWDDYIEVINVHNCVWEDCIKAALEKRIYEIAQEKIDFIIKELDDLFQLHRNDMPQCDTNLVEFVWKDSNTMDRTNDQFLNLIDKSCEIISDGFGELLADISPLEENYQNYLMQIYSKIFDFLFTLEKHIDLWKETNQYVLFGAVLFEKFLTSVSSISSIFALQQGSISHEITWPRMEKQIKAISDSHFCDWFDIVVSRHFSKIESNSLVDLASFMTNLTIWEKVPIGQDIKNESTDRSSSVIEVPIQLSLALHQAIERICSDVNKHCAYSLSRDVLIHILTLIGDHVLSIYQAAVDAIHSCDEYPHTAKQTISIQLYFDLFFIKNLLTGAKAETLRDNQLPKINDLMSALESIIDPFDLHIMFPHIKANLDRLFRSCSIIFGFLLADRSTLRGNKPTSELPKEMKHNIMLVHNCDLIVANL